MKNPEDEFDVNKWTTKELVKHVYFKLNDVQNELKTMEGKVNYLESDMKTRNALLDAKEKQKKGLLAVVGIIGSVIGFLVDLLIRVFSE